MQIRLILFIALLLGTCMFAQGQIWKRVSDSVKHKKQYGLYSSIGGLNSLYGDVGIYYNKYKILYTQKKAVGLEMMMFPYRAFAPKISWHVQVLAYLHVGAQTGIYTDFKHILPFFRPELGFSYHKFLDIRVGKNIYLPAQNELNQHMNSWQLSFIGYLRVFSKRK